MATRSVGILSTRLSLARLSATRAIGLGREVAPEADGELEEGLAPPRSGGGRVEVGATLASIAVALTLWAVVLRGVDLNTIGDLGLVSALPMTMIAPFALLLASFVFCLRRMPRNAAVLLLHTVALIVMLYGIRGMIDQIPAFRVTWRHVGIAEVIDRTGEIDPSIDAYFNWPGFFTLAAFLARAAGFSSIEPFADWAPVFFNLLYLAPLLVIMRTATKDSRVVWLGIWIFYFADWVAQDYLAPQAMALFLHLVVVAVALKWFTRRDNPNLPGATPIGSQAMLLAVTLAIVAYAIPSHQLTPFATVFALVALLLSRRLVARSLPVIVTVMTGAWVVLVASQYVSGHQENVTGGIGDLNKTIATNVGARLTGSAERLFVVDLRLITTVVVWLLALIGAWRLQRRRRLDRAFAAVALSAFPLMGLQSYGGEVLLRVYLFTLPFAAFFIASAILPAPESGRSVVSPFIVFALSAVALSVFAITRYGNEKLDTFTKNELAAVRFVYATAPTGPPTAGTRSRADAPLVVAGSDNLPWKFARYEQIVHRSVTNLPEWDSAKPDPASVIVAVRTLMRHYRTGAYLIFTRSEKAEVDLIGTSPKGSLTRFEAVVAKSPDFRRIYPNPKAANPDAEVFVLSARGLGAVRS